MPTDRTAYAYPAPGPLTTGEAAAIEALRPELDRIGEALERLEERLAPPAAQPAPPPPPPSYAHGWPAPPGSHTAAAESRALTEIVKWSRNAERRIEALENEVNHHHQRLDRLETWRKLSEDDGA